MKLEDPATMFPEMRNASGAPSDRTTITSGAELERAVDTLARSLGLQVRTQVRVARRLWGAERRIDLVLRHPDSERSLGIECKFQGTGGSAEEKIPATIQDIAAWPIPGIVVFDGAGFSANMHAYLHSTGKAVAYEDLRGWLMLFFGLPDDAGAPASPATMTAGEFGSLRRRTGDTGPRAGGGSQPRPQGRAGGGSGSIGG